MIWDVEYCVAMHVCHIRSIRIVGLPLSALQKRGGYFDQCVWLPQLHYMTITCFGM